MQDPQSRPFRKILFALAALLLFLASAEIAARVGLKVYCRAKYGFDIASNKESTLRADSENGWEWSGGVAFRKAAPSVEKPPGLYRIISVGDSVCWGSFNQADKTYSTRLEKLLRGRYGPDRVEVLNAGVPGYSVEQATRQIHKVARFHPDLILYYGTGETSDDAPEVKRPNPAAAKKFHSLLFHSKAFLFLNQALRGLYRPAPRIEYKRQDSDISRMIRAASKAGAELMLIEYVLNDDGVLTSDLAGRDLDFDVPVVRTLAAMVQTGLPAEKLMTDRVHLTNAGYEVVARCLNEEIVRARILENGG